MQNYLQVYCHPPSAGREAEWIGEAAALSRVTIQAGIGQQAFAAYLKCKVTGG